MRATVVQQPEGLCTSSWILGSVRDIDGVNVLERLEHVLLYGIVRALWDWMQIETITTEKANCSGMAYTYEPGRGESILLPKPISEAIYLRQGRVGTHYEIL